MIFVILFLVLAFLLMLVRPNKNGDNFPMYPGALPIIGNAHMFIGDNVHFYNVIKKVSITLLNNNGYLALQLGPFKKLYLLGDPDDSATALNTCLEKHYVYSFANAWIGGGLLTADVLAWKRNRKLLHPMFSLQQVRRFLPVINERARNLVDIMAEKEGKGSFNPELCIVLVALETVCQTALGVDIAENFTKNRNYANAINNLLDIFVCRFKKIWFHNDYFFNWSAMRKIQDDSVKVVDEMSNEYNLQLIEKRKLAVKSGAYIDDGKDFQPFVDTVIRVAQTNELYTDDMILREVNTLIVTSYDTTVNGLIYCLMLLGHHQDVQYKLYEELSEVFGNTNRDVEKDDIAKLVYLEAILKETIRLFPIIPVVGRHTPVELKLKNHTIPAGSDFFMITYAVNRHPMWGTDADQFRPERWFDGTAPNNPNYFATFGLGKRSCIGKTYSFLSMKTMLSHLIRRFRVTADISKLVVKMEVLLKPASGQHISLEPRVLSA